MRTLGVVVKKVWKNSDKVSSKRFQVTLPEPSLNIGNLERSPLKLYWRQRSYESGVRKNRYDKNLHAESAIKQKRVNTINRSQCGISQSPKCKQLHYCKLIYYITNRTNQNNKSICLRNTWFREWAWDCE